MAQGDMAFFSRPSSAAVKISAPPPDEPSSPKPSSKKDSTQRQCRNILIFGSCKYQDKGCIYYHPAPDAPPSVITSTKSSSSRQAVNAPVFVPKAIPVSTTTSTLQSSPSAESEHNDQQQEEEHNIYPEAPDDGGQTYSNNPYADSMLDYGGADPFYSTQFTFARQPLDYHLYTHPRPDSLQHKYFISDSIREELQKRSETIHSGPIPGLSLPEELQGYHSLVPLEPVAGERRKFGNWYSTVYRAVNSTDGVTYALRRIENFRLMQQTAFAGIETWSRIRHPNIISVREAFTTRAFNDNSLVVVYDYHPNSQTLYEAHIKPKGPQFQNGRLQAQPVRIPERTLWSYVIQIANAIKTVHDAGQAVRIIDATKILVTGKNRVRISSCGIVDVLTYEAHADVAFLQQEDLAMFGKLVFALCCSNLAAMNNLPKAVETLARHYSADLKSVALFLISKPGPHKNIGQLFDMIGSRLLTEMDEMQNAVDRLEGELMTELENARLVRLLCKFGFINERPEFAREPRWSETGDRYIVTLFRDYVFHQVDEHGNPVVNLTHVLTCLNKVCHLYFYPLFADDDEFLQLDAGSDERIMLVARDEQSCLVVSYKEIKSCIDSAFSELTRGT
ncbi:PAB-dependent poly(A)-specific ribonuclease subunit PAN3 [Grifola frondosa]|uniref:PAN2-PAN3 deadenylation complex subunit PAN3 n=1 Tax=Grifola frondosa TaxID=5627 RepID=A0A1C7MC18_GRIFR|nr:PAB-dependent poly(A)-specific ribonuclease subunit PAN3 [Grifola frondosa]